MQFLAAGVMGRQGRMHGSSLKRQDRVDMILINPATVDARNTAPVDMVNIPVFTGFYTSQVVQDFLHQQ